MPSATLAAAVTLLTVTSTPSVGVKPSPSTLILKSTGTDWPALPVVTRPALIASSATVSRRLCSPTTDGVPRMVGGSARKRSPVPAPAVAVIGPAVSAGTAELLTRFRV